LLLFESKIVVVLAHLDYESCGGSFIGIFYETVSSESCQGMHILSRVRPALIGFVIVKKVHAITGGG
jgi:hypothetical protein